MLGSAPALNASTRIYQRLIANDPDEATDIASAEIEKSSVLSFYDKIGIDVLRLASEERLRDASAEHRLRLAQGLDTMLDDLRDRYPSTVGLNDKHVVLCIGGKWEIDALAGEMLAHALSFDGIIASFQPAATINADYLAKLDIKDADIVCLSYLTPDPAIPARHACWRLRRRFPTVRIVLALWNAPPELLTAESLATLKANAVVTSVQETVRRIHLLVDPEEAKLAQDAAMPDDDAKRVDMLTATGVLEDGRREALDALAKRAAEVFDTSMAVISTIDKQHEYFVGQSGNFPKVITDEAGVLLPMAREHAICNYVVGGAETLVVPDIGRDPRFADNETIKLWDVRFYAGAPLRIAGGQIIGALCILDARARNLEEKDVALLEALASDVAAVITPNADPALAKAAPAVSSLIVGQQVPGSS